MSEVFLKTVKNGKKEKANANEIPKNLEPSK